MPLPTRIRTLSTLVSASLAITAVSILLAAYESLERELAAWVQGSGAETIHVTLLPAGLLRGVRTQVAGSIEGLGLFQPPFLSTSEAERGAIVARPPIFEAAQLAAIRASPLIETVETERSLGEPIQAGGKRFSGVAISSPRYYEVAGLTFAEGQAQHPSAPKNAVVLGSEARTHLFDAEPAVGQQILVESGGDSRLLVVGVLKPVGPTYRALAPYIDSQIYKLDPDEPPGWAETGLTNRPISTLWVRSSPGRQAEAVAWLQSYLTNEYGASADPQVTALSDFARTWGGITVRQAFLSQFSWAVTLALLVAVLNVGASVHVLLVQRRFEMGVRRSLGASRRRVLAELWLRALPLGVLSGLLGFGLAALLAPGLGEALQVCPNRACEPVAIAAGPFTGLIASSLGIGLWSVGTVAPALAFLRQPPAALLRESGAAFAKPLFERVVGGLGFAFGVAALLATLGIRDGTLAQMDRVLGWSGGERAGAFVDWRTRNTPAGQQPANLMPSDYHRLRDTVPEALVGWLSHRRGMAEIKVLEASANLPQLRPPAVLAGRWFTPEEEAQRAHVAVLGPQLALAVAAEQGLIPRDLVGQRWKSFTIIGVMDQWPALTAMGFYPDAAYVPVGVEDSESPFTVFSGQIPFLIPEEHNFTDTYRRLYAALAANHPEGQPQVIVPANEVAQLLNWRTRLHTFFGLFAGFNLLIGGVGTMNILFVRVVSRWREIGVRRALGATQRDIAGHMLRWAALTLLGAALAGGLLGTLVALFIQQQAGWPLTIHAYWILAAALTALASVFVFGGFPAVWAATRPPAEMLRLE